MSQELKKEAGDQRCSSITHKTASCEVKNVLQLNNIIFFLALQLPLFRDDRPQHQRCANLSQFLCRSGMPRLHSSARADSDRPMTNAQTK